MINRVQIKRNSIPKQIWRYFLWQCCKLLPIRNIKAQVYGVKFYVDLKNDGISKALFIFGSREIDHSLLLIEKLKPGMKCLDLGSNIGYYAILMGIYVGKEGFVTAVEPDNRNLTLLEKNLKINGLLGTTKVYPIAISDIDSDYEKFHLFSKTNLNYLGNKNADNTKEDKTRVIEIKTRCLDTFGKIIGKVDLIRMDVEGAETEILGEKSMDYLQKLDKGAIIFFEAHTKNYVDKKTPISPILQELSRIGFTKNSMISAGTNPDSLFSQLGYSPIRFFQEGKFNRAQFENISPNHFTKLCDTLPKKIRYIILEKVK
jgi:FkbM family methyltransferase